MIPILIFLILVGVLGCLLVSGEAVLVDNDLHYQYIPIAQLQQAVADNFVEGLLEDGETAEPAGDGTLTLNNELKGEYVPNAFGKDRHGVSVYDIKSFIFKVNKPTEQEAGQTNWQRVGIHTDTGDRTDMPEPSENGYLIDEHDWEETTTGAAGEITQSKQLTIKVDMPQDIIDGKTFNYLATKQNYSMCMDSTGNAAVFVFHMGIWARRVIVPLNEVFFDRDTIAGMLDFARLSALLG